ncbi:MAG: alpha/beta hydrolase-fold protein [Bacteroidota bacterium]
MIVRVYVHLLVCLLALPCTSSARAQEHVVTIQVLPPAHTPEGATLYLAGQGHEFGDWNPAGAVMAQVDDTRWAFTGTFEAGRTLVFNVTRGTWGRQALSGPRTPMPATTLEVTGDTTVTLQPTDWEDTALASATGSIRYHHHVASPRTREARDLVVWLPPGYDEDAERRYPVLYIHDGQNVFDRSTSYGGSEWRMDEVADSLIARGQIEPMIVVGINNTQIRWAEYSGGPFGRIYADFLVNTVKPLIDGTYRTRPDRDHTAVMGASMGGLISFYLLMWHPEVFSKAAALSSAFPYDNADLVDHIATMPLPSEPVSLYFDNGTQGIDQFFAESHTFVVETLRARGLGEVFFETYEADHTERDWARRLWRPLTYLFGTDSAPSID